MKVMWAVLILSALVLSGCAGDDVNWQGAAAGWQSAQPRQVYWQQQATSASCERMGPRVVCNSW